MSVTDHDGIQSAGDNQSAEEEELSSSSTSCSTAESSLAENQFINQDASLQYNIANPEVLK